LNAPHAGAKISPRLHCRIDSDALLHEINRMPNSGLGDSLRRLKKKVADAVVQDVPPELEACEVCRRTHCDTEEWLTCERRIAAARFVQEGNAPALEQLRRHHARPTPDGAIPARSHTCPTCSPAE
jgi:hypothetical protein